MLNTPSGQPALDSAAGSASNEFRPIRAREPSAMWSTTPPIDARSYCLLEFSGRLMLAQADATQRTLYLVSRLGLGMMDGALRSQILRGRGDDAFYMAELAQLEERGSVLMEAGAEGCVTILRNLVDDIASAQIQCLQQVFGTPPKASARPALLPFLAPNLMEFGRRFTVAVHEEA